MTHKELCLRGITGPMLIFGGPYSNLQALQAVKAEAEKQGIPPENCICTGDIVAYCAQPLETVTLIKEWGIHCVMGNCEESFADNADDCGCGFEEGTACDLLSAQWFTFANQQLGIDSRQWFASLPRQIRFSINEIEAVAIHGSLSSINQFIFPSTPASTYRSEIQKTSAQLIIGGHCGIPFTRRIEQQYWHNAGAIGMPANDGTTRSWYSLLQPYQDSLMIEHYALEYDYATANGSMKAAGMNNGYAQALLSGLWPSMDVLPEKEKSQQGKALAFEKIYL